MDKKWKDRLLSSGHPLEFEAASILKNKGFAIDGEFPYTRKNRDEIKEFSVDLAAHHYLPPDDDPGGVQGQLKILCECKYRSPEKSWLFTPDINEPDFSPLVPTAIRSFPGLSAHSFEGKPLRDFGCKPEAVLKGVEVFKNGNNTAFDKDIRHAINQLRYALPSVASDALSTMLSAQPDDSKPIFIAPMILTNAELFLFKENTSLSVIQNADTLEEIIEPVPFVEIHSSCHDDFWEHAKWGFKGIGNPGDFLKRNSSTLGMLEDRHRKDGKSEISSPLSEVVRLFNGGSISPGFYSQFLVVSLPSFSKVIDDILKAVTQSVSNSS